MQVDGQGARSDDRYSKLTWNFHAIFSFRAEQRALPPRKRGSLAAVGSNDGGVRRRASFEGQGSVLQQPAKLILQQVYRHLQGLA